MRSIIRGQKGNPGINLNSSPIYPFLLLLLHLLLIWICGLCCSNTTSDRKGKCKGILLTRFHTLRVANPRSLKGSNAPTTSTPNSVTHPSSSFSSALGCQYLLRSMSRKKRRSFDDGQSFLNRNVRLIELRGPLHPLSGPHFYAQLTNFCNVEIDREAK